MKYPLLKLIIAAFIAVILSLFISSTATGQESILSDTSYIAIRNDTVFQVKKVTYANGRKTVDENPIGRDTSSALVELRRQAYDLSQQYSLAMLYTENEAKFRRTIMGYSDAVQQVTGRSYFREISNILPEATLLGEYTLKVNGTDAVNATILKNAQGNLRLRIGGTNYTLDAYSELLMRVRNYQNTDFFLVRPTADAKRWTGGGRKYILTKIAQR